MIQIALYVGLGMIGVGLVFNVCRLAAGPTVMDRVLAADTMVINTIALVILYGMLIGTRVYFETALLFAMFGFTSTVAYCRYVMRGDIIE